MSKSKSPYEQFQEYLMERFPNMDSDQLIRAEESGLYQKDFLSDSDMPLDTELQP